MLTKYGVISKSSREYILKDSDLQSFWFAGKSIKEQNARVLTNKAATPPEVLAKIK
jgi:hypothetical protein